tara:strand:+ start:103 stop:804 length:702 start_codon:yes stop_codon:yes gene_type:complete
MKLFFRFFVDQISKIILSLSKKRKVSLEKNKIIKVNIGCGLAIAEDWINIDASLNTLVSTMPILFKKIFYKISGSNIYYSEEEYLDLLTKNTFIHHDLSNGIPLHDDSADFIYSSHFIEHLYRDEAEILLKDCYRVLKIDGTLRIILPDLSYAIEMYHSGNKDKMLQNYFFIDRREGFFAQHKYMYDFEMFESLLLTLGFKTILKQKFKEGLCPDIEVLDNRPEESFYLEAIK